MRDGRLPALGAHTHECPGRKTRSILPWTMRLTSSRSPSNRETISMLRRTASMDWRPWVESSFSFSNRESAKWHRCQRRPKFVAQHGEKAVLGNISRLGFPACGFLAHQQPSTFVFRCLAFAQVTTDFSKAQQGASAFL